jgi:outer membrane protein assembly factor BamB
MKNVPRVHPHITQLREDSVVVVSYDDFVYFINSDGTQRAKYKADDGSFSNSSFSSYPIQLKDGTVVAASEKDYVYFLNPDGTLKAKFKTGDGVLGSPTQLKDGTVVVSGKWGYVFFLNPDGTQKAKSRIDSLLLSFTPIELEDGTVVVGRDDGQFYFLSVKEDGVENKVVEVACPDENNNSNRESPKANSQGVSQQ